MTDYSFEMTEAKREAVPPLIALWGMSGSGKTLSALYLARGIVGYDKTIAVLDTENGRAKFYADEVGGWKHVDMQPPFTPEKYSAGFKFCEDNGADIIIVDSASHVWEGIGGVMDMAESAVTKAGNALTGLSKWNKPKMEHKRMMNNLMRSSLPVIFCLRAKESMKQVGQGYNAEIVQDGWKPIAEKNFIYEMTLALRLTGNGYYDLSDSKIPKDLRDVFPNGGQVNNSMGEKLQDWLSGGEPIDAEFIKLRREGEEYSSLGTDIYKEWYMKLSNEQRLKISKYHDGWKFDASKSEHNNKSQPEDLDPLEELLNV